MERRPGEFAVGLFAIILHAICVLQFRFDEMTTRHSLAIEQLLESRNAAARAEQFALRSVGWLAIRRAERDP